MTESQRLEIRNHLNDELAIITGCAGQSGIKAEYTADEIDYATQITQRNLNLALAQRASSKAVDIENALKRVGSDDYGICDECGEDIGIKRLMANPAARLCVRCQEEMDNGFGACA